MRRLLDGLRAISYSLRRRSRDSDAPVGLQPVGIVYSTCERAIDTHTRAHTHTTSNDGQLQRRRRNSNNGARGDVAGAPSVACPACSRPTTRAVPPSARAPAHATSSTPLTTAATLDDIAGRLTKPSLSVSTSTRLHPSGSKYARAPLYVGLSGHNRHITSH
jgi:hypothetical protein